MQNQGLAFYLGAVTHALYFKRFAKAGAGANHHVMHQGTGCTMQGPPGFSFGMALYMQRIAFLLEADDRGERMRKLALRAFHFY
uniref:Uncharacterized protein n=1 Tax=uncultured Chloroflexi bacterium Rifle_16ft_4_minimus_5165 TaxID=1665076 RepID=A0A0H4TC28_9CHLR|nr:hypothetical protein [uncultured Chloroflexi bacterium Rifle_16ft_4_minimus_5165]